MRCAGVIVGLPATTASLYYRGRRLLTLPPLPQEGSRDEVLLSYGRLLRGFEEARAQARSCFGQVEEFEGLYLGFSFPKVLQEELPLAFGLFLLGCLLEVTELNELPSSLLLLLPAGLVTLTSSTFISKGNIRYLHFLIKHRSQALEEHLHRLQGGAPSFWREVLANLSPLQGFLPLALQRCYRELQQQTYVTPLTPLPQQVVTQLLLNPQVPQGYALLTTVLSRVLTFPALRPKLHLFLEETPLSYLLSAGPAFLSLWEQATKKQLSSALRLLSSQRLQPSQDCLLRWIFAQDDETLDRVSEELPALFAHLLSLTGPAWRGSGEEDLPARVINKLTLQVWLYPKFLFLQELLSGGGNLSREEQKLLKPLLWEEVGMIKQRGNLPTVFFLLKVLPALPQRERLPFLLRVLKAGSGEEPAAGTGHLFSLAQDYFWTVFLKHQEEWRSLPFTWWVPLVEEELTP